MAVPTQDLQSQIPDFHFDLNKMEVLYEHSKSKTSDPHRHDYYTVILVLEGTGIHTIDFNSYDLKPFQIYFVSPGQVHQLQFNKKPKGWVITFDKEFLTDAGLEQQFLLNINLFRPYSDAKPIELEKSPTTLLQITELINHYFRVDSSEKTKSLGAALKLFLIECINLCTEEFSEEQSSQSCLLIDFKKAIEENYRALHKVSEYAELLHITPKHLNSVIKSTTGFTAKEYIIDRILTEAKRQLIHTNDTVKTIAINLGFKIPLNFNNFFKKRTKLTPLQFRKEH